VLTLCTCYICVSTVFPVNVPSEHLYSTVVRQLCAQVRAQLSASAHPNVGHLALKAWKCTQGCSKGGEEGWAPPHGMDCSMSILTCLCMPASDHCAQAAFPHACYTDETVNVHVIREGKVNVDLLRHLPPGGVNRSPVYILSAHTHHQS